MAFPTETAQGSAPLLQGTTIAPKFDPFKVIDVAYKHVNATPIPASILIPRTIIGRPGRYPLAVHWHGGFLVTGYRLFADWYPQWTLDFCLKQQIIVVSADHRLIPEAKGLDVLEDVKALFAWLQAPGLGQYMPDGIEVDAGNVLVMGESAGGWLSWQSALLFPDVVGAAILQYPMLDLKAPHYSQAFHKNLMTPALPQFPASVLDKHLASLRPGQIITSATPPDRLPLAVSIIQQGRTIEVLGDDTELYPFEILASAASNSLRLPPMWIIHGRDDTLVPVEGTYRYMEQLRGSVNDPQVHLTIEHGEHGFDGHPHTDGELPGLETNWVKDGVDFIQRFWPRN